MASMTTISNKALNHIRAKNNIADFDTDTSTEAKDCRLYGTDTVNEILEEYDWRRFSRRVTLAPHADTAPSGWSYRLALPSDMVVPRELIMSSRARNLTPLEFDIDLSLDGQQQTLVCDVEAPTLRYTSNLYVLLVDNWPFNFREAVTYKLASKLAMSIKKEKATQDEMFSKYIDAMGMANHVNQTGRELNVHQQPASIASRK